MERICDLCKLKKEGEIHYEEPLNKNVFWCFVCILGVGKFGYNFKPKKIK